MAGLVWFASKLVYRKHSIEPIGVCLEAVLRGFVDENLIKGDILLCFLMGKDLFLRVGAGFAMRRTVAFTFSDHHGDIR